MAHEKEQVARRNLFLFAPQRFIAVCEIPFEPDEQNARAIIIIANAAYQSFPYHSLVFTYFFIC